MRLLHLLTTQDSRDDTSRGKPKLRAILLIIIVAGAAIAGTYLLLTLTRNREQSSSVSLQGVSLYAPRDFHNQTGTPSTGGTLTYVLEFVTHDVTGTFAISVNGSTISSSQLSDIIDLSLATLQSQNYTTIAHGSVSWDSGANSAKMTHGTYNATISIMFSNSQSFKFSRLLTAA